MQHKANKKLTMPSDSQNNELALLPLALANVPAGLRQALAQEGTPTIEHGAPGSDVRFVLFDSAQAVAPGLREGQAAIDVAALREGHRGDPFARLVGAGSSRCRWQVGPLELTEEVAAVDKHALRQRLLAKLRLLVEAHGGVWATVAAYPFPYRSAFNLRADYDRCEPEDFAAFWQAIEGREGAVSHFVCAAAVQPKPELLGRLAGSDVGSHGYHHHSYRDDAENLENIRRGIAALQAEGIEPSGFAAPHGRWSAGLGRALDALGVSHSSEFALAYDALPFWPADCQALQIPVHPLCLGLFLESAQHCQPPLDPRAAAALAATHWRETAQAKYAAGQPLFFYDHPDGRLGRHPHVVRQLFETVAQFGSVWWTTMTQFAAWWRARQLVALRVVRNGQTLRITVDGLPAMHRFGCELWHGNHVATLPLDAGGLEVSPAALAYQARATYTAAIATPVRRPGGIKQRLRQYLDWELETPLSEIGVRTWPGWLKHRLRARRALQERHR